VKVPGADAEGALTASFVTRSMSTGEESREVREFALVFVKDAGAWRISRATAVDVLKQ
jgi:hypothetical protein